MPLLLYGCAAKTAVSVDPEVPRRHIVVRPARPGFVIGAPHGTTDPLTGDFAAELARRTGFGLAVASGIAYEKRVQDVAQGPLAYYAEIHRNDRRESANRIEIATVGVDALLAARLRTLYELIRDAHLRAHPAAPRVEALVEPADKLFSLATGNKRALHLELPRAARSDARELYLAILADFLSQAATLPEGR